MISCVSNKNKNLKQSTASVLKKIELYKGLERMQQNVIVLIHDKCSLNLFSPFFLIT